MTTARQIIQLSLEGIGIIGAGETIGAEDAEYSLRQLNTIVDRMSAGRNDLFKDQLTSGTVTGATLTLGTGSFLAVGAGQEIQGMLADNFTMSPITMEQYRDIYNKNNSGRPINYAYNGFDTIYLYPAATGNVMTIQSRADLQQFADLDTNYLFPSGYMSAFIAALAVAVAPSLMSGVTPDMIRKESVAMKNIEGSNVRPIILNANDYKSRTSNIINGFN